MDPYHYDMVNKECFWPFLALEYAGNLGVTWGCVEALKTKFSFEVTESLRKKMCEKIMGSVFFNLLQGLLMFSVLHVKVYQS